MVRNFWGKRTFGVTSAMWSLRVQVRTKIDALNWVRAL